jgi:hypothetical protein
MLVVATRRHVLFIVYRDVTHHCLARDRRHNDFLINAAIGVAGLVPIAG